MSGARGWIGVDLDGTLAHYDGWKGPEHIGMPVAAMWERVVEWLRQGRDVRIMTARVCTPEARAESLPHIESWCLAHFGRVLPVTHEKDFQMIQLWDDRAVQVMPNTGKTIAAVMTEAVNDALRGHA